LGGIESLMNERQGPVDAWEKGSSTDTEVKKRPRWRERILGVLLGAEGIRMSL
jgi:hypothetical protein